MADVTDNELTLKQRLKKALLLADKLKREGLVEKEVNRELAKRNEVLRREVQVAEERRVVASHAAEDLEVQVAQLLGAQGGRLTCCGGSGGAGCAIAEERRVVA
eukprot:CAMPEP_0173273014 /NCGR_PEP_ID=MMETSP1143-20121109/1674_1 /TAXON_ID=483371 /ORGANISM="non described non described, Strain CCMP2298" /LENGTH=103 /DNA_ID=CAMNT_0014209717 /DNA_START=142 /DNA_END=450 /DNA_ORIENTATION=+